MCQKHHTLHVCGCTTVSRIVNLCRAASPTTRIQPSRPCKASRLSSTSCTTAPRVRKVDTFCPICCDDGSDASLILDSEDGFECDSWYTGSDDDFIRDDNGEFLPLKMIYGPKKAETYKTRRHRIPRRESHSLSTFDRYLANFRAHVWWMNALLLFGFWQTMAVVIAIGRPSRRCFGALCSFVVWYLRSVLNSVFSPAAAPPPRAATAVVQTIPTALAPVKKHSKFTLFLLVLGLSFPFFGPSLCANPEPPIPFLCYLISFLILLFSGFLSLRGPDNFIKTRPMSAFLGLTGCIAAAYGANKASMAWGRYQFEARRYAEGQALLRELEIDEPLMMPNQGPGFTLPDMPCKAGCEMDANIWGALRVPPTPKRGLPGIMKGGGNHNIAPMFSSISQPALVEKDA